MAFPYRMLDDRVLIELDEVPDVSEGGVILAPDSKPPAVDGRCIANGPGERTADGQVLPMRVVAGDRVKIAAYSGNPVKIEVDGQVKEFVVMHDREVLMVMDPVAIEK